MAPCVDNAATTVDFPVWRPQHMMTCGDSLRRKRACHSSGSKPRRLRQNSTGSRASASARPGSIAGCDMLDHAWRGRLLIVEIDDRFSRLWERGQNLQKLPGITEQKVIRLIE